MKTCWQCEEQIPADKVTCPLCGVQLDPPPYVVLSAPRNVPAWLPPDLATFFVEHEGCGMDDSSRGSFRLARLAELEHLTAKDIYVDSPAWKSFDSIAIGAGQYGDWICYVLNAPVASRGAIMAFGGGVAGPGGTGPDRIPGSLVLAPNFTSWLARLREDGWEEYGLTPGSICGLPEKREKILKQHFQSLNLGIGW